MTAIAAATLVAAGCGGGSDGSGAGNSGYGRGRPAQSALPPTVSVRTADCSFWVRATGKERDALLAEFTRFFGAPTDQPGARGSTLRRGPAITVLDRGCQPVYAAHFKLYKIYGRAAGFTAQQ